MKKAIIGVIVWIVIGQVALRAEDAFYRRPALFSTRPQAVYEFSQSVDRFGPVGIGIELTQPAFGMKVKNVEPGSPAAATGKIRAGQIIETINGEKLKDIDPRIQLGNIVTRAEATDGKVTLVVRESKDSAPQSATVNIPVLGAYSETWPVNCPKSDAIVRHLATRFKEQGHSGGIGLDGPMILFLLSTGEEEDLDVVHGWVKAVVEKNRNYGKGIVYQWHVSWGAPPLAEYYLRTGDESVLPLLKQIADAVKTTQHSDGWSGRGGVGHHMGLAGTGTLTFLLLAKQCGVDVDDVMLQRALLHYYRFAGRGTNPYMDYPPEGTYTDNGRNGRLAFAMAAASRLRPEGEDSLYAKARDMAAMTSFYSTSYMLHGHTGGGIGEVWRSAAMGLMVDKRPHHYREFMDQRTWFYDLSRRYDGSFGILGGGDRYDKESWGIAMGLTYTAPRKKLCIFGAPQSKYAKTQDAIPYRCWGNEAGDSFISLEPPVRPDGETVDLDQETIAADTGLPVNRQMDDPNVSDDAILRRIYHPEVRLRETAAAAISKHKRYHLIPSLLKDKDPRIRNVGILACSPDLFAEGDDVPGFPRDEMRELIFEMLNDPAEAWFNDYRILNLVKDFDADALAPHAERITEFLSHEEWWLRRSALEALVPLMADSKTYKTVLPAIEEYLPNFWRWSWDFSKRIALLQDADPEVQKAVAETLGRVYAKYPGEKAVNPPGGISPTAHSAFLRGIAYTLDKIPGGLDVLFKVSRERYPNQTLPHSEQFLARTDLGEQSPDLQKALRKVIVDVLIPKHVAGKWDALQAFADAKSGDARAMDELQKLYDRAGIKAYNWEDYGPDQSTMKWYYYCFDPKEKWFGKSDRLGRYRDVTFPEGMENWFAKAFDPKASGWKQGVTPFGAADGKKEYFFNEAKCGQPFCRCDIPIHTLWDKDVILMHGTFKMPVFEEGHCYRLLYGGISHVGSGGGYSLYVNGKLFMEDKHGVDRRAGGRPIGRVITKEFWPEFSGQDVTLAAISFMKHHPRTGKMGGNISFFLQRMKVPPLPETAIKKATVQTPMTCSEWQELQDPERTIDEPDEGKFLWDGKHVANPDVLGTWQSVDQVAEIADFVPGKQQASRLPKGFDRIVFKKEGKTDSEKRIWSGDTLMDVNRYEALKMSTRAIGGADYLFVEAGGFSKNHPVGWTSPWVVFKRATK